MSGHPLILSFLVGFCFRLALVAFGVVIDGFASSRNLQLQYTDADYHVFSDAALLIYDGKSPYDKFAYRYPPLLAVLLIPNHFLRFPEFGKVLFCLVDAAIVFVITGRAAKSNFWAWAWALNPLTSMICSRGSADCFSNFTVLASLHLVLDGSMTLSGMMLGLAIYLRLYPVIYLPAFVVFLVYTGDRETPSLLKPSKFLIAAISSAIAFASVSYAFFGSKYLEEAILYHVFRVDHRHNFSPHFYSTYLQKSESLPRIDALTSQPTLDSLLLSLLPFMPQCFLLLLTAMITASAEIELCLLAQTLLFVAYNKVCTAQYFTWYLCFFPLVMPRVRPKLRDSRGYRAGAIIAFSFWALSFACWLWRAHALEMRALNSFSSVWISSLAFHVAQCGMVGLCLYTARHTEK